MIKSILSVLAAFAVVAVMGACGKCKKSCKSSCTKRHEHRADNGPKKRSTTTRYE